MIGTYRDRDNGDDVDWDGDGIGMGVGDIIGPACTDFFTLASLRSV